MTEHAWERAPREDWKEMPQPDRKGWFDVPFHCPACGCFGHSMHKDGEPPAHPEEARNPFSKELVDPLGDCDEQTVESVHGV